MIRGISRKNLVALLVISLLLGGVVRFAFTSSAATSVYDMVHVSPKSSGAVTYPSGSSTSTCTTDCQTAYTQNSGTHSFHAHNPISGYQFDHWDAFTSDGVHHNYTANPLSVESGHSWTLIAYFSKIPAPAPTPTPNPTPTPSPSPSPAPSPGGGDSTDNSDTYVVDNSSSADATADNSASDSTDSSADNSAADSQAPTVPQNVAASFDSGSNTIGLTWDDSTDDTAVAGYEIQRSLKGSTSWSTIGTVATGQYSDFEFAPNQTYEYQVRAFDDAKNYSDWSPSVEVTAGDFKANVTVADGGTVKDSTGSVTVSVPGGAVTDDILLFITKVNIKGMNLPARAKLVGNYYDIKAKDVNGKQVNRFKRQIAIKFNYSKLNLFGVSKSTMVLSSSEDGKVVSVNKTLLDGTNATTLTDHLTIYFLTAASTGVWGILAWILLWLAVIGGLAAAGYFGWRRYQLYKYQQDHREDFIYKH